MHRKSKTTKSPSRLSECNHGDYVIPKRWHRVTLKPLGMRRCKLDGSEDNRSTGWEALTDDFEILEHRTAPPSVDEGAVKDPLL